MSFRRYVRKLGIEFTPEVPDALVQESLRRQLTVEQKHSIIESSWRTREGEDFLRGTRRKWMSVRYVTGGQRHGLPASLDWKKAPNVVEFQSRPKA